MRNTNFPKFPLFFAQFSSFLPKFPHFHQYFLIFSSFFVFSSFFLYCHDFLNSFPHFFLALILPSQFSSISSKRFPHFQFFSPDPDPRIQHFLQLWSSLSFLHVQDMTFRCHRPIIKEVPHIPQCQF